MKKVIFTEDWELETIEDNSSIFAIIYESSGLKAGYVKDFGYDFDMLSDEFEAFVEQLADKEDTTMAIHLVKFPSTKQVEELLKVGSYTGEENNPKIIEAVAGLLGRADCEFIETWSPLKETLSLVEKKKKRKKPYSSIRYTTGWIGLNMDRFNKAFNGGCCPKPKEDKEAEKAAEKAAEAANDAADTGSVSVDAGIPAPAANSGNSTNSSDNSTNSSGIAAGDAGDAGASAGDAGASGGEGGGAMGESLDLAEDAIYSHRHGITTVLPSNIKILSQDQVKDFISKLEPEEEFVVGYVTPVYFYEELMKLFSLVKATELYGYTGMDYRDVAADKSVVNHDDRLKRAANQIADPETAKNTQGELSADYAMTNKLTLNKQKDNFYFNKDTNQVVNLSKILFYPAVNSKPKVVYYVDLKDGKGYFKIDSQTLHDVLYDRIIKLAELQDIGFSSADSRYITKTLGITVDDFIKRYPGLSVKGYKDAIAQGIDPKDYLKKYPFSKRWSTDMFSKAVDKMIASDAQTTGNTALAARQGWGRQGFEDKPTVRALYINQIYFLAGKPGQLGQPLNESLQEEVLREAKRYVKRYYVRPQNIFCSNKEEILKALVKVGDENCSIYSLKSLADHDDVHLLKPSDIIYYYDEGVLYDKNHVKVMDYDLFVKHEEERKKVGNVDTISDSAFNDIYDDRLTDADLKNNELKVSKPTHEELGAHEFDQEFPNINVYDKRVESLKEDYEDKVFNLAKKYEILFQDGKTEIVDGNIAETIALEADGYDRTDISQIHELEDDGSLGQTMWTDEEGFDVNESLKEDKAEHFTCCICGEESEGYGNNPAPVKDEGRCCDACNTKFVIPARIAALKAEDNE